MYYEFEFLSPPYFIHYIKRIRGNVCGMGNVFFLTLWISNTGGISPTSFLEDDSWYLLKIEFCQNTCCIWNWKFPCTVCLVVFWLSSLLPKLFNILWSFLASVCIRAHMFLRSKFCMSTWFLKSDFLSWVAYGVSWLWNPFLGKAKSVSTFPI